MKKLSVLFLSIAVFIFYTSCSKNNDLKNPDPVTIDSATIMGFKDSTQLIKSITGISYDSASGGITDSATQFYFYDTLNKKIILSLQPVTNSTQSYDGIEYNYNNAGLVSHISWKYFHNTQSDSTPFISSDYIYDDVNVLKSASVNQFGGKHYTISFNKTVLSNGGYQLAWKDTSPYGYPDSSSYIVNFDAGGKMQEYYYVFGNTTYWSDSSIYDSNGNFSKILTRIYSNPGSSSSYTFYDFISRDTKGDQLYNLNQIVNNGLANIPNSISYSFIGVDAIDDYVYQYSKYPALTTKIYREDQSGNPYYVNFNSAPQYDSKDRLVKYRMFFNDAELSYGDYIISYYK